MPISFEQFELLVNALEQSQPTNGLLPESKSLVDADALDFFASMTTPALLGHIKSNILNLAQAASGSQGKEQIDTQITNQRRKLLDLTLFTRKPVTEIFITNLKERNKKFRDSDYSAFIPVFSWSILRLVGYNDWASRYFEEPASH